MSHAKNLLPVSASTPQISIKKFNALQNSLEELLETYGGVDGKFDDCFREGLLCLSNEEVTLTFGGHFKSGKSTTINAALGRAILPMDDLPETGALCRLRSGAIDKAEICTKQSISPIACTTAAIQQEISLISQNGSRRVAVNQVDWLNLTLQGSTISDAAIWVDSPGINDTEEMNERAMRGASVGDMLIWVLSSRQPLSETEMQFLAQHIAARGPLSVIFALNAFLLDDSKEQWAAFCERNLPAILNKITYHAKDLGYTQESPPLVVALAGRAALTTKRHEFGIGELRDLLTELGTPKHTRIRCARLNRIGFELKRLLPGLKRKLTQEQTRLTREQQEIEASRKDAEQRQHKFLRAAERAIDSALSDWATQAVQCGNVLVETIGSSPLQRDNSYSKTLNQSLGVAAATVAESLVKRLVASAREYNVPVLDEQQAAELKKKFAPPSVSIAVPDNDLSGGTVAKYAAGGAAAAGIIPGIGWIVGGAIGAVVGGIKAISSAAEEDIKGAKANAMAEAEKAKKKVQDKRGDLIAFVTQHCAIQTNHRPPNQRKLRQYEALLAAVTELSEQMITVGQH